MTVVRRHFSMRGTLPSALILGTLLIPSTLGMLNLVGCSPTVKVQAPDKPITINLNIKLDAEVRVKLEEQAKQDIKANPDIF